MLQNKRRKFMLSAIIAIMRKSCSLLQLILYFHHFVIFHGMGTFISHFVFRNVKFIISGIFINELYMHKEEESNHHKEKERSSRHIIFFKLQNIIYYFLTFLFTHCCVGS